MAARSALKTLEAAHFEDLHLRIVLPASGATVAAGTAEEKETVQRDLRLTAALIAQRIGDETIRVRWFRGPLGRELSRLAEPPREAQGRKATAAEDLTTGVGEDDAALLWLLVEGRTNAEIARQLGISERNVTRRITEMYAKIGVSSRGEAAVFAFRAGVV